MTLLKANNLRKFLFLSIGIAIIGILIGSFTYSCGIQHISLTNDLQDYEKSLDPDTCYSLLTKIIEYNDDCEPTIDILDCG